MMTLEEKLFREEYPFAMIKDYYDEDYDYAFNCVPDGWHQLILDMCFELKQCLIENKCLDKYEVYQVKEKFGSLRWYDNQKCTNDIIRKYENLSEKTCVCCGKPSTHFIDGWIVPMCNECDKEKIASI